MKQQQTELIASKENIAQACNDFFEMCDGMSLNPNWWKEDQGGRLAFFEALINMMQNKGVINYTDCETTMTLPPYSL